MDLSTNQFTDSEKNPKNLGKQIYKRMGGSWIIIIFICFFCLPVCLLLLLGTVVIPMNGELFQSWKIFFTFIFMLPCSVFSLIIIFYFLINYLSVFYIYTNGIAKRTLFKTESLSFNEIESFWQACSSTYMNGAYAGNNYEFHFFSTDKKEKPAIKFLLHEIKWNTKTATFDPEIVRFVGWLNNYLLNKMRTGVKSGNKVFWTDRISFCDRGIFIKSQEDKFSNEIFYFYNSISHVQTDQDLERMAIFSKDKSDPILIEKRLKGLPNNIPGVILLNELIREENEKIGISNSESEKADDNIKPTRPALSRTYPYGDPTNITVAISLTLTLLSIVLLCWAVIDRGPILDKRNQVSINADTAHLLRWFLFGLTTFFATFALRWAWIDKFGKRKIIMKENGMFAHRTGYWFSTEEFVPYQEMKDIVLYDGRWKGVKFQFNRRKFYVDGFLLEPGVFEEFLVVLLEQKVLLDENT